MTSCIIIHFIYSELIYLILVNYIQDRQQVQIQLTNLLCYYHSSMRQMKAEAWLFIPVNRVTCMYVVSLWGHQKAHNKQ